MAVLGGNSAAAAAWTPASPTTDGGVSPHTWHYAGSEALYQDSGKTTLAAADDDPVGASVNQGSDTHDITQATTANKPTLKLNVLNGRAVMRFDNDRLGGAFNASVNQPYIAFMVAQLDAAAVNDDSQHRAMDTDDGSNYILLYQFAGEDPDTWAIYGGNLLKGATSDGDWNIWSAKFHGNTSQFWLGGISEASGDAGTDNPDGISLGESWVGDIAEILIYDANLSNADKNEIGAYLADKYGLSYTEIT